MHSLKIARARAGLTMTELADKAGVGVMTISEIERGIREPQATTIHKIAKALELDPAALLIEEKVLS